MFPATPQTSVYLVPPTEVSADISPLCCSCYEEMRAGFATQAQSRHTLAPDPRDAEIILAPIWSGGYGPCFELLRRSRFFRDHAAKLVVYSPDDNQFPALRGLYPAASPDSVRKGWTLPAHYISTHLTRFQFTREETASKDLLFSFVGSSRTYPVREKIMDWKHPRGIVVDVASKSAVTQWWERPEKMELVRSFREIAARSRFMICPRGVSPSSIRLYEAMEASAVPVILADDLALPLGPDWESCCLRVAEREVDRVPSLIEQRQDRAQEMGAAARRAWECYFSPQATIGSVVAWATRLLTHSAKRPPLLSVAEYTTVPLLRAKVRFAIH